jgi:hypothetical protein
MQRRGAVIYYYEGKVYIYGGEHPIVNGKIYKLNKRSKELF